MEKAVKGELQLLEVYTDKLDFAMTARAAGVGTLAVGLELLAIEIAAKMHHHHLSHL